MQRIRVRSPVLTHNGHFVRTGNLPSGNVDLLAIVCSQSMSSQDGLTGTADPQAPGVVQAAALDAHSTGEDVRIWRPASLPHVELLTALRSNRLWRVFHEHYCFCVIPPGVNARAELALVKYRGRSETYRGGSTSLMEPGEAHANIRNRAPADFWVINIDPSFVARVASEEGWPAAPHFRVTMSESPALVALLSRFYESLANNASLLEQETHLATALQVQLETCGERISPRPAGTHAGVKRAQEYLHSHVTEQIGLDTLASVAGLSRFQFARAFSRAFDMPPHTYHNQLRVAATARALRARHHLSDIETGFYDRSHLNKHFNRSFGVTANTFANAAASTLQLPRFDAGPAHTARRIGPG